jgi:hypothetical protein
MHGLEIWAETFAGALLAFVSGIVATRTYDEWKRHLSDVNHGVEARESGDARD